MERCDAFGFTYRLEEADRVGRAIVSDAGALGTRLTAPDPVRVRTRQAPDRWSPLEYGCHLRDVLLVQRERVLAARRAAGTVTTPMGRDERVDLDDYGGQDPVEVARQLSDAAGLLANVLDRLGPGDWDRTLTYSYPERAERSLRWVALHTEHEVVHHRADVEGQLGPGGGAGAGRGGGPPA